MSPPLVSATLYHHANLTYTDTALQDIKDLISLEDVMEELGYGPNGGLLYCMEYLLKHLAWLDDELGTVDDDYFIIDCPGMFVRSIPLA